VLTREKIPSIHREPKEKISRDLNGEITTRKITVESNVRCYKDARVLLTEAGGKGGGQLEKTCMPAR